MMATVMKRKPRVVPDVLSFLPQQVWIDEAVADHPQTMRILNSLPTTEIEVVPDIQKLKHPSDPVIAKRQLILTKYPSPPFRFPHGKTGKFFDGDYREIALGLGRPFECSYCSLQTDRRRTIPTISVDVETILGSVGKLLKKNPDHFFHFGYGDSSDALMADHMVEYAAVLIRYFSTKQNAVIELKTRSSAIDHLLNLRQKQRAVLSWILNTERIISSEERGTASLDERLTAAKKALDGGFRIGFHLDPIVLVRGEESELTPYLELIDKIFSQISPGDITWIHLGLLKCARELPSIAMQRFPLTKVFAGEMIPDGSLMRPPRFLREMAYRPLWDKLTETLGGEKIFLTMEKNEVWEKFDPAISSPEAYHARLRKAAAVLSPFQLEPALLA